MKKLTLAAVAVCFALGGTAARAQDAGALLDLLVKKKLITDQEAEEVRGELMKESARDVSWEMEIIHADHRARAIWRCTPALRI